MFSLKKRLLSSRLNEGTNDFLKYLETMNEHIKQKMESDESLTNMTERALLGEREAVLFSLNEIEKYTRSHPFNGQIPAEYQGLTLNGALFQEWIGFGAAYAWFHDRNYADSAQLQIVGRNIYYSENGEYKPYPYKMSSVERTEKLRRALVRHDPSVILDESNPEAEFKVNDPLWTDRFLRVAIWIKPRVWEGFTTITFRRQTTEYMSIDDQAGTGIIPFEAVNMLRSLVKTFPNVIVSGPVNSGKTTFANTLVGEMLNNADISIGVAMIEKHPESTLPLTVTGHRFMPIVASDEDLMDVGIQSLRHDTDIVYMTEMRWNEWQFYNYAGEKGYRGLIATYHTEDAEDIPYQGAFAVYANKGGSLKGHLISTIKSCEIIAVLEPMRHGKKRLVSLSEIKFDGNNVTAFEFMKYNYSTNNWEYNANISSDLIGKMSRKYESETQEFISELKKLESKRHLVNAETISQKSRAVLVS